MDEVVVLVALVVLAIPVLLIVALALIAGLRGRVHRLEQQVAQLQAMRAREGVEAVAVPPQQPSQPKPAAEPSPPASRETAAPPPTRTPSTPPPLPQAATAPASRVESAEAVTQRQRATAASRPHTPARPDPVALAARAIRRWFTEGNVPVKVGMLVLFAGVAALLKYASDQGWMRVPMELRLAGIAAAALAGLVFGWRHREGKRTFALSLQGGAVGVLLLVVFAAFKLYHLLPAGAAFALSIAIVAGAGVLAVAQNAVWLALLAVIAGFLAPLWLSTGSGNHIALFGYYAVLNAAIFAIAWWRSWRPLNLVGFVFTFGIGALWGVWNYRPDLFGTTEPFLAMFFGFYLLIPILHARRLPPGRTRLIEGGLVFATPLIALALQAGLLQGERMPLAWSALALAGLYALLAAALRRREHYATLSTSYAVLAVGFATLSVPLALSAQATASVFAVEGAALVWLGLHQRRRLPQVAGLLLQLLAAGGFVLSLEDVAPTQGMLNARFMSALLISLAGFASAWSYRRSSDEHRAFALPYYLWALAWWIGNALSEIVRYLDSDVRPDAMLAFAALSGWIAAEFHRRLPAQVLAWTVAAAFASALPLAIMQDVEHVQPFAGHGAAAWLAYALAGWRSLMCLRDERSQTPVSFAHTMWLWAWPLAVSLLLGEMARRWDLGLGWRMGLFAVPWLAVTALTLVRPAIVAAPLGDRFARWRATLLGSYALVLTGAAGLALFWAGDSRPLPWLPLLNPLELAQLGALGLVLAWLGSDLAPAHLRSRRIPLAAFAAFGLITVTTLRTAHHWGGVSWNAGMFDTSLMQTSLTIVWSMLGVLGWIVGSRRGQRTLWLAGAVLMAVVLAKLVLVDRQHLGNLLGIASFIAYGLLCTAVGYFAPAPPRATMDATRPTGEAA